MIEIIAAQDGARIRAWEPSCPAGLAITIASEWLYGCKELCLSWRMCLHRSEAAASPWLACVLLLCCAILPTTDHHAQLLYI